MVRFLFDSTEAAAQALLTVLQYARETTDDFEFGGLTLVSLVESGMWLTGDVSEVAKRLDEVPGAVRQVEVGR